MSLREVKKERTRLAIADTAWRLFAERGFDRVTVAEVARATEVAEATIYNYFPTKEDLFFARLEAFEQRLLDAVRARPPGETALAAVRRHLLEQGGLLAAVEAGDADALDRLRTVNRVIAESAVLQAHEQRSFTHAGEALATLLADELGAPPDDIGPQVAAYALLSVHRTLVAYVRTRVLADTAPRRLTAEVRQIAEHGFALLERGFADYAPRPS